MEEAYLNPDFLKIPNYERSGAITTHDVKTLTYQTFRSEYVNRNRPCLIKGAALHWKACSSWQSLDYLKSRCGDAEVEVHSTPVVEADPLLSTSEKKAWLAMLLLSRKRRKMRFAEFLDKAVSGEGVSELFFIYSIALRPGGPLDGLRQDVAAYPFLKEMREAIFGTYPRNSVYFYRSALTDWHYHPTAEALQTQVLGTKEVLLLPPSETVWSYMFALQSQRLHLYDADLSSFPQARQVIPFRAVLHPGDALYIPTYWWHLVSTRGNRSLGATVPTWWRSPFHIQCDPRVPAARAAMRALLRGAIPWWQRGLVLPALMTGVVWSTARRWFQPAGERGS